MRYLVFLLSFFILVQADESELLNSSKQSIVELKTKQVEQNKEINQYQWLTDITASASVNKDDSGDKSEDYALSLSQDIFKFGGISSQIEYAKELAKMQKLSVLSDTKEDLSALFSSIVTIKTNLLKLEQNRLNIENSIIDIKHKTSQYKEGEIGISDLNDAIMTKNSLKESTKELELSKLQAIATLASYTDSGFESINLPEFKLPSKELFVQNALSVKYADATLRVNDKLYAIKKSDYLPTLSFNASAGYSKSETDSDDYHNYGLKLSMPLSYTATNDIEQSRLEKLISQAELNQALKDVATMYDKAMLALKSYKERIELAQEDIKLYNELLVMNEQEYEAGYKTIDDVQTLKNSMKIRELDIKTYELSIKQELLNLYFQL